MSDKAPSRRLALGLLTLAYAFAFVDRQLLGILGGPIRAEFGLGDTALGLLAGPAFALFYTLLGVPVARFAERRGRVAVISGALALWSGMTALSGLAGNFGQLVLARVGVGVGEAGCAAPAQSLIAELHAPERRATAAAIFSLGVPAGMMVGAIAGGWFAQTLGWRWAFVGLGLPGLALALVLRAMLAEPGPIARTEPPPLAATTRALLANQVWRHMAIGATLASFAGYGLTGFAVTYAVRQFALPIGVAATGFGLAAGVGIGLGIGGGGWLSDRLGRRSARAPGMVAGFGALAAAPLVALALAAGSPTTLLTLGVIALAAAHLYFGPTYGVTVNAVTARERASAIALLLLAMNLIGLGIGPLAAGALSDRLARTLGSAGGLRAALSAEAIVYLWAGTHFLLAARAAQPHNSAR